MDKVKDCWVHHRDDKNSYKLMSGKTVEIKVLSIFHRMLVKMWQT